MLRLCVWQMSLCLSDCSICMKCQPDQQSLNQCLCVACCARCSVLFCAVLCCVLQGWSAAEAQRHWECSCSIPALQDWGEEELMRLR